ncbi:hypothetical protein DAH66_21800 [Sphingomonas koreensis]|jgi:diacylglycerol kinase (ATP)|uniref:Uncharacterized protein n=1 Tax=Sphingomonas koreensis TaxID=93064 RepID=A0A430FXM4_9SPHN|nr:MULTISPECIES: diacylglycerol kinase family protein [Sphingomonas]MDK2770550.1 hypothetical protein [Sphingomonas sp.]RSY76361.1 hypothetical protein DAH66_21800 [Sphingomonas koreensis]
MTKLAGHRVQIIHNKSAGRHSPAKLTALRAGFEARGAEVVLSECGPGLEIAIDHAAAHVCAVGGDGTVRHVALAIARCGRSLPMSVYPSGTVNLVHREFSAHHAPHSHAGRVMRRDRGRSHYAVQVNDTLFFACASVGPDSRTVAALSPRLKRHFGRLAYVVAIVRVLVDWRRDKIEILCEGRAITCEAFYVAKGRYFAGPWSIAQDARLGVPLLHVLALTKARRRDFIRLVWALLTGRRADALAGVTAFTCTALTARAAANLPVQADGDIAADLPAGFELRPDPILFR